MTRDEIISEAMNASEEIHMTAEYENGFINGAEWARGKVLEDVCEWLKNCKHLIFRDDQIGLLMKAMTEKYES